MPITFPSSPSNGQTYTVGARTWTWSGSVWELNANTIATASVGTGQIADNAITTAKIAAEAVVEADIASNAVTAGKLGTDVQLGYRNVVINGAMQVAQRGTSVAGITATNYYTADRWWVDIASLGTWTQSVENDAPTGSGLRKSLKMTCTTADASPAAGDFMLVQTSFEGQNLQQFLKGTASAKGFMLTFWVKGTTTGTYVASLYDNDNARNVGKTYTIDAANTWEKKTLAFPADTTGAFDNDNAQSLRIWFGLGLGTNFTSGTLPATWASYSAANSFAGQTVNLAGATNRSWQITGVQLEAGSVATPFEFEDYGTTLAKCQRYYDEHKDEIFGGIASSTTNIQFASAAFSQVMRAAPTIVFYGNATANSVRSPGGSTITLNSPSVGPSTRQVSYVNVSSGLTTGTFYQAGYTASAEL